MSAKSQWPARKAMGHVAMLAVSCLLIGCAAYSRINLAAISVGMSKQEVIRTLGKAPDNFIGSKQYPEGVLEVVQYSRLSYWDSSVQEQYWLYFFDNKLVQWGRPGDWEAEADQVYELRVR